MGFSTVSVKEMALPVAPLGPEGPGGPGGPL